MGCPWLLFLWGALMTVLVYLDGDQRALVERVRSCGVEAWGRAAYLWQGEIEAATAIYAPARPDIVAAYVARGVPEFAPASLGEIGGFVGDGVDGDGGGLECRGERRFEAERKQAEPIVDRMRKSGTRVDRVTKASKK